MSSKLQALCAHLLASQQCTAKQLDSWVDARTLRLEPADGGQYMELCQRHSRCTVLIERFHGDADIFEALLAAWIQDHDDPNERSRQKLPDPEVEIEPLGGNAFDIDITIEFLDPLLIEADPAGPIGWNGQQWSVISAPVIDTATDQQGVQPQQSEGSA